MVVIVEYKKIRTAYPEFVSSWEATKADVIQKAQAAWGLKYGGLFPESGQFGETTIRPRFFSAFGTTTGRETWNRNLGTAGWNTVIDDKTVIEDVYIGLMGFLFPNASNRVSHIRLEAGKRKLPVINLEGEIDVMEEPAVIFETGIVIPEEDSVKLRVYATRLGHNVIKPLGFAMAKSKVLLSESPS